MTPKNAARIRASIDEGERELLAVEVKRLRRALRKIAECPNPDSVEDCHDRMWVIAKEALSD